MAGLLVPVLLFVVQWITQATAKCPVGTVQGLSAADCYYYSTNVLSWLRAEEECVQRSGHLASVHSGFANAFFSDLPNIDSSSTYWLGGSMGIESSVKWTWTDGSSFSYTNWDSGQPTSSSGCLSLNVKNGLWYSISCVENNDFICNIPPIAVPQECSGCPTRYPCDSGWTFFESTSQCYKVIHGYDTWLNYEAKCRLLGAHLASIHSQEEEDFVQDLSSTGSKPAYCGANKCDNGVWIGFSAQRNFKVFEWSDGTPVNYTYWVPGQRPADYGIATFVNFYPDLFPDDGLYSHYWDNLDPRSLSLARAGICKTEARN